MAIGNPAIEGASPKQGGIARWTWRTRYLAWFCLLTIIDGLQTSQIVSTYGLGAEVNPLMRFAIEQFSFSGLWAIKLFAVVAVFLALPRLREVVLRGSVLLMLVVVGSNLAQMLTVIVHA